MTRRFVLRQRAEDDIQAVFEWYESQRPGLGEEFLSKLRVRLEAIREYPESSPLIYRQVRLAVVAGFPYVVFYVAQPAQVSVLAILHHHRSPATWPVRKT